MWSIGVTLYHVATGQLPFQPHGGRTNRPTMLDTSLFTVIIIIIITRIRSVERGICPIAADCTVLLCCRGHVTLATPTFRKLLPGVTSRLSLSLIHI